MLGTPCSSRLGRKGKTKRPSPEIASLASGVYVPKVLRHSLRGAVEMTRETPILRLLVMLLSLLVVARCGNCKEKVVSSQRAGDFEIAVHHRICGSVSGYNVSIAPPGMNLVGRSDQYEPFMMECCYDLGVPPPHPVEARLASATSVVIRFDAARAWTIVKQRPTQGTFNIVYEPYGTPRTKTK